MKLPNIAQKYFRVSLRTQKEFSRNPPLADAKFAKKKILAVFVPIYRDEIKS